MAQTTRLLLIDENPENYEPLIEHMRALGYEVRTADGSRPADTEVIFNRPVAVLLHPESETFRAQIRDNLRIQDIPMAHVFPERDKIDESHGNIELAILDEFIRQLR